MHSAVAGGVVVVIFRVISATASVVGHLVLSVGVRSVVRGLERTDGLGLVCRRFRCSDEEVIRSEEKKGQDSVSPLLSFVWFSEEGSRHVTSVSKLLSVTADTNVHLAVKAILERLLIVSR